MSDYKLRRITVNFLCFIIISAIKIMQYHIGMNKKASTIEAFSNNFTKPEFNRI